MKSRKLRRRLRIFQPRPYADPRHALIQELLDGPRTGAELAEALGHISTGGCITIVAEVLR
ncbi:hypothetical protein [Nocardia brasiliensis]|uniref:hypothetical protein n=1 Tax=Nocardia brasiliensis TaxID=37326 RepID=UPI000A6466CB|nr:hypothetical protein [Nocardia brasiliensis]